MAGKKQVTSPLYNLPTQGSGKRLSGVMWEVVVVGLLAILLVSWAATQYLASKLGYQAALGEPIANFIRPIYQPFAWIVWGWKYGDMDNPMVKDIFGNAYMGVTGGVLGGIFLAAYMSYRRTRNLSSGSEHIHGSAHWATPEEATATGLLGTGQGVYVGAYQRPGSQRVEYLRHDGPEHIMAFAPTRSGKGVGLVLPTLLSWPHSALIYDIKGENFALTAGWRREEAGNHTLKFEPTATDGSSVRFNPLEEIRLRTDKEVSDVQNIVTMIVDPDGKGLNDHWAKTGHALLVGAVLHVLYAEPDKTLTGVSNFLSDPSRTLLDTLNYMLGTEHDPDGSREWAENVHPVVAASARDMLNKSENEMSGVLSTAMSFLTLYRDPVVSRNTAVSEFKVRDLMNADKPVSLYLVVPPSDKDRLKPLIRLIVNQVVRTLTEKMEFKDGRSVASYKHRLLLLIDEFPSLGKLDIFEEALAFIAGYGMKAYLIIQDISQLWTAYGKDESIFSNCHVRVAYAPNKIETAELLSKMTGTATIVKESTSYSGDRLQPMLGNVSTSQQEVSRALLTPDEVMRLPAAKKDAKGNVTEAGDMLVFVAGHSPIYGKQILYFLDPTFSARAKIAAPTQSDRLMIPAEQPALDAPAEIPQPQQPPKEDIAASYTQVEATAAPVAAAAVLAPEELSDDEGVVLIEDAPDDIADPAPPSDDDDIPPPEHMQPPPSDADLADVASAEPAAPRRTGDADDLLNEMKALSADSESDAGFMGMFDDVLDIKPTNKPKAAASGGEAQDIDLSDGMVDLLSEVANEPAHRGTDRDH
ncbi:MAG: IncP-type conjugal transfer protein TraG [Pseudomonadota bacterium]|nr:IncP-type conjugal transfer protein TraG [Pseudomonadota bacterium]